MLSICTGNALCASADTLRQTSFADRLLQLDWPVAGVPVVGYAPETGWELGAAVAAFFPAGDAERRSYMQVSGAWTTQRQWYVSLSSNLYLPRGWFMLVRGGYRDYPDSWYGIGNDIKGHLAAERYASRRGTFTLQPQYRLPLHWSIGLHVHCLWEDIYKRPEVGSPSSLPSSASPTVLWGLGPVVQYDTRDELYYPRRGLFFKAVGAYYGSESGSTARVGRISADLRQFVPLYKDLIFAWQFSGDVALGKDKPFQLLPTLGGQDLVRGVRRNMFRDDVALALQAELRIPVWSLLKATVFAGVGDVYNLADWRWAVPKVGYGAGVRACFNKAKIHLRFDVARSNVNPSWRLDGWSFYFTCTEAF